MFPTCVVGSRAYWPAMISSRAHSEACWVAAYVDVSSSSFPSDSDDLGPAGGGRGDVLTIYATWTSSIYDAVHCQYYWQTVWDHDCDDIWWQGQTCVDNCCQFRKFSCTLSSQLWVAQRLYVATLSSVVSGSRSTRFFRGVYSHFGGLSRCDAACSLLNGLMWGPHFCNKEVLLFLHYNCIWSLMELSGLPRKIPFRAYSSTYGTLGSSSKDHWKIRSMESSLAWRMALFLIRFAGDVVRDVHRRHMTNNLTKYHQNSIFDSILRQFCLLAAKKMLLVLLKCSSLNTKTATGGWVENFYYYFKQC